MGKFTAYKIPLASMPQGLQTFEFHLDKKFFEDMENPDIHDADLDVLLTIDHKADLYNMLFSITGTITLICDRCLDDLIQMSAMLKKHRTHIPGDEDADLEDRLIDEIDSIADETSADDNAPATDPRWDALKGLNTDAD